MVSCLGMMICADERLPNHEIVIVTLVACSMCSMMLQKPCTSSLIIIVCFIILLNVGIGI
jgi:hypothetical protein